MTPRTRTRLQWLLVALVALHLLVVTSVFVATGALPTPLFVLSIGVYATMLVAAVVLFATAPRRHARVVPPPEEPAPEPAAEELPRDDPRLLALAGSTQVTVVEATPEIVEGADEKRADEPAPR